MDAMMMLELVGAMGAALVLGGLIGLERERRGHWAGLRTHMMVSLGACIFVLTGTMATSFSPAELSRIIQGIATGVGFIGAGTIIKLTDRMEVRGLTTASSIWLAAAVGTACGGKFYVLAVFGTAMVMVVLIFFRWVEHWINSDHEKRGP